MKITVVVETRDKPANALERRILAALGVDEPDSQAQADALQPDDGAAQMTLDEVFPADDGEDNSPAPNPDDMTLDEVLQDFGVDTMVKEGARRRRRGKTNDG